MTSVLLPGARIGLFTRDAETKEAFQALEKDWRFARIVLEVHDGDVESAVRHYGEHKAPDLIIIQTDKIDDGFSGQLDALAAHLSENTSAIVIGPVNDVNLYRKLVSMGVSDYLVKPVTTEALAEDIAKALIDQIGATGSRLIALMGAKGGVGTTALTEALAWGISDTLGQKTFLLDAAGGWSTLSVGINFEPSTTLIEAARAASENNEDSLTRMIHQAGEKLSVLSSGADVMLDDSVSPQGYEMLLDYLMALYPVVLIDLSAAPSGLKGVVLTKAHQILVVSTPILPSVRATRTLLHEIKDLRGGDTSGVEVIINMQGFAPKCEVSKSQIQEGLSQSPAAVVPFNPDLFVLTESEGTKLGDNKNGVEIVRTLLNVIQKVLAAPVTEKPDDESRMAGIGRLLTKLKTKS